MKKLGILLFTAFLICIAVSANSQIKFGVKGALNFNDYKTKSITLDNRTGWQAGIMARFKLPIVGIGVQPEVLYTQKRSKYVDENSNISTDSSYLQIPVNAIWTFGIGNVGAFVTGGPYFSYAVDFDKVLNDAVDRFDWGLGLGAGLDISKVHAGVRYDWGLQNIAKDSDAKVKNKAFSIFVGFFF